MSLKRLCITACLLLSFCGQAWAVDVLGVRMWPAPDNTRLVFDVSAPIEYSIFALNDPDRIVIDINGGQLRRALPKITSDSRLLRDIRSSLRGDELRIVLDLKRKVDPKNFVLKPYQDYGHRLVIDLYDADHRQKKVITAKKSARRHPVRDVVIAVDAGHGGEDSGARGRKGTREKVVVMQIARKLARMINKQPGMKAVLIRKGDYYISLRRRVKKARFYKADFLVSIHADAFRDRRTKGASVYALSRRGASSEAARWLAERENAADLLGGVSLDDKDNLLASVLLDLSQTATLEASMGVGQKVLNNLKGLGKVHKKRVQQAGFAVLKSPDIPSVLVETAFISNPKEERKLRTAKHQRAIARSIFRGIRDYFAQNPPPNTLMAMNRRHKIARGDTLSQIAQRYHVSVDNLRQINGLRSDRLIIGAVLQIPVAITSDS